MLPAHDDAAGVVVLAALALLVLNDHLPRAGLLWSLRGERYGRVAAAQGARGAVMVGIQAAAGTLAPMPAGLLGGQLAGQAVQVAVLARGTPRGWPGLPRLRELAARYREFPLYGAPQALVNALSQYCPRWCWRRMARRRSASTGWRCAC